MRVVITGGCGFLGQHVAHRLRRADPALELVLLDLRANPRAMHDPACDPGIQVRTGRDVCVPDSIVHDLEGADVLIHMAGVISFAQRNREWLYRVNVEGTRNVVRQAVAAGVGRMVHISSVAALGYDDARARPIDETFRFDWRRAERHGKHYMLSKRAADEIVRGAAGELPATILYPGLMWGPGDLTTAIKFVRPIARGRVPLLTPGGTNIVDVRDVAAGVATVVGCPPPSPDYALCGENVSFATLAREIARVLDVAPPRRTAPRFMAQPLYHLARLNEAVARSAPDLTADGVHSAFRFRYCSHERARRELDWEPRIPLRTTIEETIRWLLEHDPAALGPDHRRR